MIATGAVAPPNPATTRKPNTTTNTTRISALRRTASGCDTATTRKHSGTACVTHTNSGSGIAGALRPPSLRHRPALQTGGGAAIAAPFGPHRGVRRRTPCEPVRPNRSGFYRGRPAPALITGNFAPTGALIPAVPLVSAGALRPPSLRHCAALIPEHGEHRPTMYRGRPAPALITAWPQTRPAPRPVWLSRAGATTRPPSFRILIMRCDQATRPTLRTGALRPVPSFRIVVMEYPPSGRHDYAAHRLPVGCAALIPEHERTEGKR